METIVIIEDDESIREMLRYYFRSVGYEVACFESGEDYFEKEGEVKPSLYILDIMLPGMDGLEILRRIRTDARLEDTPVLMLTARTSEMAPGPGEGPPPPHRAAQDGERAHLRRPGDRPRRPGGAEERRAGGAHLQGV